MMSFVQKILADSDCHRICDDTKHAKTNQIIIYQWHTGVDKEMFYVNINIKLAQTTQNSWNFIVGKSSLLKKWYTSVII